MQHCWTTVVSANPEFLLLWVIEWSVCQVPWSLDLTVKGATTAFSSEGRKNGQRDSCAEDRRSPRRWSCALPHGMPGPLSQSLPSLCTFFFPVMCSPSLGQSCVCTGYVFSLLMMPPFVPGVTIALSWDSNKEMRSTKRQWGRMLDKGGRWIRFLLHRGTWSWCPLRGYSLLQQTL